jgi:hypothetical protein
VVTKATEIKLEDDRDDAKDGFRDRRRGIKLVPARKSVNKGRTFNIGVAENMFSPRVAVVDRSGLNRSDERALAVEADHVRSDIQVPDTLRTVITFGVFLVGCTLGFLIGRGRD